MRYIIRPKPHLQGKKLKHFYRQFANNYIPGFWPERPVVIITIGTHCDYVSFIVNYQRHRGTSEVTVPYNGHRRQT